MQWKDVLKQIDIVTTDNSFQLVPTDMLKLQSRIFPDPAVVLEDPLFTIYCNAAEHLLESICGITLRQKTLKLTFNYIPIAGCHGIIRYERPPVISITNIKYYDENDTQQTLSSTLYESWLTATPPMVLIGTADIPALSSERTKRLESTFVAGHASAIPPVAQLLILELVSFWYQQREAFGRLPSPQDGACYRSTQTLIDVLKWRLY